MQSWSLNVWIFLGMIVFASYEYIYAVSFHKNHTRYDYTEAQALHGH